MPSLRSLPTGSALKSMLAVAVLSTLAACGGGDDSPAEKTLTISGTAATGAAIASGAVSVTCKTGTGTATTGSDGSYTVKTSNPSEGPCVISVTTTTGVVLRSFASGDGAKANVTPLTEMLVDYIVTQTGLAANASPAALASSTAFANVVNTPTVLSASVAQVVKVIKTVAGSDVTVPTDFLTATLVPKSGSTAGNSQDQILDLLKTKNVITSTGAVSSTVDTAITTDANAHKVTGATGGT